MTGRHAALAARVDEVERTIIELSARVQTLELVVRPPTVIDGDDVPGGAS